MKKYIAMLLAAVTVLSLVACTQTPPAQTEGTTPSVPVTEGTEPTQSSKPSVPSTEATEPTEQENEKYFELSDGTRYCTFIYDDSGKLVQQLFYRDEELYGSQTIAYNEKGYVQDVCQYDANGELMGGYGPRSQDLELVIEVSETGCTESQYYSGVLCEVVNFDTRWNVVQRSSYEDGVETERTVYTYDKNDLVATEEGFASGVRQYGFVYDETGEMSGQSHYEGGKLFWRSRQNGAYVDTEFYDTQGRVSLRCRFEDWSELWLRTYRFDENGILLEEHMEEHDEHTQVLSREVYYYSGNTIRSYDARNGWQGVQVLDDGGRVLWEETGSGHGTFGEYSNLITYTYAADGSYIKHFSGGTSGLYYSHYDSDGKLLESYGGDDVAEDPKLEETIDWSKYEYNEHGDVISLKDYFFGKLENDYTYEYEYDEHGNWIIKTTYLNGAYDNQTVRVFDEKGMLVSEADDHCSITHTYDDAGRLIKTVEQDSGSQNIYTYEYDDQGRLVQKVWICVEG